MAPPTPVTRPAEGLDELSEAQQRSFQAKMSTYQMKEKWVEKVAHGMRIVDNALKASARTYKPHSEMDSPIRGIITILADRYKRSDEQIAEQIHDKYRTLQQLPSMQKIEKWVADWENFFREIVDRSLIGLYGNEAIFVNKFLKSEKQWTPSFCETWVRSLRAAKSPVKFYETAKEYRIAVELHLDETKDSSRGGWTWLMLHRFKDRHSSHKSRTLRKRPIRKQASQNPKKNI